jgi:hypothetical protein
MRKPKFLIAILSILTASIAMSGAADVNGTVRRVIGDVELIQDGRSTPLSAGSLIPAGAIIKTGPGSSVEFSSVPGSWVLLEENTEFRVEQLRVTKKSMDRTDKIARFSMNAGGNLVASVQENPKNAAQLVITINLNGQNITIEAGEGTQIVISQKGIGVISGAIVLTLWNGRVFRIEDGFFFDFATLSQIVWQFLGLTQGGFENFGGTNGALQNPTSNTPGESNNPPPPDETDDGNGVSPDPDPYTPPEPPRDDPA